MKDRLYIVKIGGNVINHKTSLDSFLEAFSQIPGKKILVHGGGKIATDLGHKLGIKPNYVDGRRITDDATINLVTMVYGGLINKQIVASLNALQVRAIGLTGADGALMVAHRRPVQNGIDYGWVGDIDEVNNQLMRSLIEEQCTPVVAPLTADLEGHLLNTNADTIASVLAGTLSPQYETHLIYCFEKNGVLMNIDDDASVVEKINWQSFEGLKNEGVIHDGMLPKLTNAFNALNNGAQQVVIGNSDKLADLISEEFIGCTRITR